VNALILGVIFYLRNPGRDSIDQKEHRMNGTDDKPIPGEPPENGGAIFDHGSGGIVLLRAA